MKRPRFVFTVVFIAFLVSLKPDVSFALPAQQVNCSNIVDDWSELRSESFALLYPRSQEALAQGVFNIYRDTLETEYARYSAAFESTLTLPILVRIYPTANDYFCLNPLASELAVEATHAHVGNREIALIAESILADPFAWDTSAVNAFRHELAALFVVSLSEGAAPAGLQAGVGGYAEDPAVTFRERFEAFGNDDDPDHRWSSLWEDDLVFSEPGLLLETTSQVAYLVDVYGWSTFLDFVRSLPNNSGYRQALVDNYGASVSELERQWEDYFALYVDGRYRANVLHELDLSVFESMIAAGAYADAVTGLENAILLLETLDQLEKQALAQGLLQQAESGLQASNLLGQARQALQAGDYPLSVALANQAETIYTELGSSHRQEEIDTYRSWATEVLQLRAELDQIQNGGPLANAIAPVRLGVIGNRLAELGDVEGALLAQEALQGRAAQRNILIASVGIFGGLVCLFLLWRVLSGLRTPPPPEAQLG
ncbi:MAG: hypothetical protein DWQ07_00275 [Chloroflexi bacterium]|nr:MAG: hypothetical protein DWQ07_00275 [Chloroflexota bacterium]MBL1195769.1 hypothetical protein [Chloroflexota bacterium]NOH13060.1 hypothetical protein [Chloroflexota bacterium]